MKSYIFSIVSTMLLLMLTSCSGPAISNTLGVVMTEFSFEPSEFAVPAGEVITLNILNTGAVEHEFVIMKLGTSVGNDFGDEDEENIYWEVELLPNDKSTVTFTAPAEPGEYQVVCGTPGHFMAGMVGTLTVVAP